MEMMFNKSLHTSAVDSDKHLRNNTNSTLGKALLIKLLEYGRKDRVSLWQRSAVINPLSVRFYKLAITRTKLLDY